MALQSSGAISFGNINTELGVASNTLLSLNSTAARTLAGKVTGVISLSNFYGKSRSTTYINGQPWKMQYWFNTTQSSSDLTGWVTRPPDFPIKLRDACAIVTKGRVYIIGGINQYLNPISTIYTTTLTNGRIGNWVTTTSLPAPRGKGCVVLIGNKIYYLGGMLTYNTVSNVVYVATVASDGTIGSWSTTNSLAVAVSNASAVITKNRIYMIGGSTASSYIGAVSTVQTASIDSEGNIGTWSTTTSLPAPFCLFGVVKTNSHIYLVAGEDQATGAVTTTYHAPIDSDGVIGTWTTGTAMPGCNYGAVTVYSQGKAYVFGWNTSFALYVASINADGTLGSWSTGTSLPFYQGWGACFITSSRLYLVGGQSNGDVTERVSYVAFSGGLDNYLNSSYS